MGCKILHLKGCPFATANGARECMKQPDRQLGGRGQVIGSPGSGLKVLFIAGYARSGSTVLERVLALDKRFAALGEVKHLWELGYVKNALCGCGAPFSECAFWREIDERAFGRLVAGTAERLAKIRRTLVRPKTAGYLLSSGLAGGADPRHAGDYLDHVATVYRAAREATGAEVILDGSKDAVHGLLLSTREDIELHVLHLVRDPRGVAYSCSREKVRPEIHWKEQSQAVHRPARTAVVWSYRNTLAERLRSRAASYRLVRYEDFVRDPARVLMQAQHDVGLETNGELVSGRHLMLPITHSISGNGNRFEDQAIELRSDERWRSGLTRWERLQTTLLSAPLIAKYGYRLRG